MKIEVFGTGCAKCQSTKALIKEILEEHEIDADLIEVTNVEEIISREVYVTPAVAVDGVVKISGRVPTQEEALSMLNV